MEEEKNAFVAAFHSKGFQLKQSDASERLHLMAKSLSLSAAQIAAVYQRFSFSPLREYNNEVKVEDLDEFQKFVVREQQRKEAERQKQSSAKPLEYKTPGRKRGVEEVLGDYTNRLQLESVKRTPAKQNALREQESPLTGASGQVSQDCIVLKSYNKHLTFSSAQAATSKRMAPVMELSDPVNPTTQIMLDSLEGQDDYLEARMLRFASAVEAAGGPEAHSNCAQTTQEKQWFLGTICGKGKGSLDPKCVYLEGTSKYSEGCKVHLDLERLESCRLFPGQVVLVEGINSDGKSLHATNLVSSVGPPLITLPEPKAKPEEGPCYLSVVVGSGPFSMHEDLSYEPLHALVEYCSQQKPDLLVLSGPFVDSEHPKVKNGLMEATPADMFEEVVLTSLLAILSHTSIVIVPSTRDLQHLSVFPQPAMEGPKPEGLLYLSNPSTFSCRGVTFGIVTTDVLRHILGNEVWKGSAGDRIAAAASHVLAQQSYYPLFPPARHTALETMMGDNLKLSTTPDVLLFPSELTSFVKSLQAKSSDVLCVNPGRLSKGCSRGSFAHLQFGVQTQAEKSKCVAQHCRVDIKRI